MIEHPGLSGIVGDELRAVAGAIHLQALVEQRREVIADGAAPIAVYIRPEEILRAGHHQPIGALCALAASASRTDEVVIAVVRHNHRGLDESACNLLRLASLLNGQSVFGELNAIDVVERSPEEIVLAVVLNEAWVDAVLDAHLGGDEELVCIMETTVRSVAHGNADATLPRLSPLRLAVVEHVLPAYIVDVGCPDATIRHKVHRARLVGERRSGIAPLHKVARPIDGHVVCVLGGIHIEVAIVGLDHGGIGQAVLGDGVRVGAVLLCQSREGEKGGEDDGQYFHTKILFGLCWLQLRGSLPPLSPL